ncbi:MAG: glutamate racemase [Elusimicrobiota bacterium]|jgi:glutamate racemase|nr:glutamate racemase [Elusimicrobiota bacterium]
MKQSDCPIGIFDSGFGGLTVMSAVCKILPSENIIYFGDTAHLPYGSKSKETVLKFSKDIADFLISKNIKMLVVACNTASAFALKELRKTLKIEVAGVIEAGSKKAVLESANKRIGVIGTQGAMASGAYKREIKKICGKAQVFQQSCPLFVPIVEEGWTNTKAADEIAAVYLKPLAAKKIDVLVLGCTHYPLLKNSIRKNTEGIKLIDSALSVALEVKDILERKKLKRESAKKPFLRFYASDDPKKFQTIGRKFFSSKIKKVEKIVLD